MENLRRLAGRADLEPLSVRAFYDQDYVAALAAWRTQLPADTLFVPQVGCGPALTVLFWGAFAPPATEDDDEY